MWGIVGFVLASKIRAYLSEIGENKIIYNVNKSKRISHDSKVNKFQQSTDIKKFKTNRNVYHSIGIFQTDSEKSKQKPVVNNVYFRKNLRFACGIS